MYDGLVLGGQTPLPSQRPDRAGTRAGRYTLLDHFASGGTADLWVAVRDGSREVCLLKQLAPELVADARAARRLQREASIAFRLDHPSFARMLSAGDEGGRFCIATELVAGQNLAVIMHGAIEQKRPIPFDIVLAIAISVLEGLAHLHDLRDEEGKPMALVHRDLSAANVLVGFGGDVKIIDFGAMHGQLDDFQTAPGVIVGTPEAMSPEQAMGGTIDRRTDLYAVAVLLHQLLTGRNPFGAPSLLDVLERVRSYVPPPVSAVRPDVPVAFAEVLQRAMKKDAALRFSDALEMQHALREAAGIRPASKDTIARYMTLLLPDELARLRELIERGHQLVDALQDFVTEESMQQGAFTRAGVPMPSAAESQVRTAVVRMRSDELAPVIPLRSGGSLPRVSPSAFTPSVMEMPGTAVVKVSGTQLVRDTRALRTEVDRWRARFIAAIAAGVAGMLVVGVAVAVWFSRDSASPVPTVAVPASEAAPVAASRGAEPEAPSVAAEALPEEPGRAAPAALPGAAAKSAKTAAPATPTASARAVASPARSAAASKEPPAAKAAEPAPAAKAAEPPEAAPPSRAAEPAAAGPTQEQIASLRAAYRSLQEQPRDTAAFDALVSAIKKAAQDAPPARQRLIASDLLAAERSYDTDPLLAAINKLAQR